MVCDALELEGVFAKRLLVDERKMTGGSVLALLPLQLALRIA